MKIKITPFDSKDGQLEGEFRIGDNFYYGKHHSAGMVTKIRTSDDWLDQEMVWVSRSEIPFVTSLRHSRVKMYFEGVCLVSGGTPFIKREAPFFKIKDVNKFPSDAECTDLIREYCGLAADESYHFTDAKVTAKTIRDLYKPFDYKNNLLIRAGSCLYKANVLLSTSSTFAEEIYINTFIALEATIEYVKQRDVIKDRKKIVEKIGKLKGVYGFKDYEEEMRDGIRNDIIHPFRDRYDEALCLIKNLTFVDSLPHLKILPMIVHS